MSFLQIYHRTTYRYTAPVRFGVHRLVLRPREGHRARVLQQDLHTEPRAHVTWMTDVHGNHVAYAEFTESADSLTIHNKITLDLLDEGLPPLRHSQAGLPLTYLQTEQHLVAAYCTPVWPEEAEPIRQWIGALPGAHQPRTALEKAHWLVSSIHSQLKYRRREEPGVQSPAETIGLASGSCRDLSTLAMEAARAMGIPARFVSGYLNSQLSEAGRGSTHAWLEVYLPDGGWRGFDPTSGRCTADRHIATGVSYHPRGVMPVSGTFDASTGSSLGMKVELTIRQHSDLPTVRI